MCGENRLTNYFFGFAFIFFNFFSSAAACSNDNFFELPLLLNVGLGYGKYQHLYGNDGNAALLRLGIEKEWLALQKFHSGIELGIQSGTSGTLKTPQDSLELLGYLPIQTFFKTMLDVLLTGKFCVQTQYPFFFLTKAGVVLRDWQFTRCSVNNVRRLNPEVIIGIGSNITPYVSLSLAYQGIYGGNPNFWVNSEMEAAHIHAIPSMNGALLQISIRLDKGNMG